MARTTIQVTRLSEDIGGQPTQLVIPIARIDEVQERTQLRHGLVSPGEGARIKKVNGEIILVAESPEQIRSMMEGL